MKECRGDRSIEISQRKQQSEREREIQHPTKSLLAGVYYTDVYMYFTGIYYTGVYFTCVYYTGVYYTSINYKIWTARSLDHRSAYNTSFLLKGT